MLKRSFNGFHGTFVRLHESRSLVLYSTSAKSKDPISTPPLVEYLVKSVGFSEDEAVAVVSKVSHRLKPTRNSELVVDFLKSSGFDESHIRKVFIGNPSALRCKIEKTLKPKIGYFQELGFSGSDLGLIVSQQPRVLRRSLEAHIVPALEILKSIIGDNEQLIRFMLRIRSQNLLSGNILKNLPANLLLLQSYGLPRDKIKRFVLQRCHLLLQSTRYVKQLLQGVEEKLGIPRTSTMFMYGIYGLSARMGERLESWVEIFQNCGWSRTEILTLLRRHPLALTVSEKEVRFRLKYFMDDFGCGSDYLASHPVLLSYSMEKRIVPRTAVIKALKEKQLLRRDIGLSASVSISECRFMGKYVLPFKDTLPELYQYYTKTAH